MSINPTGAVNYNWNYSNQNKEGYSPTLIGTVVAIQEIQKRSFSTNGPGMPEFWPDGNPKMNIRIVLVTPEGQFKTFTFQPVSGKSIGDPKKIHNQLFALTGNTDMMNLIGKTIQISTEPGTYGAGNPRPFTATLVEAGPYQAATEMPAEFKVPKVLCNDAATGGQMVQPQPMAPQNIQQPPMQGAYFAPPMPQAQPVMQPQPQPMPQAQPAMQQQPAGTVQPMMPAGMDPNVAAAMQAIGATNVQPVNDGGAVYDQDIPF